LHPILIIIVGPDPTIFFGAAKKMLASSASMMRIRNFCQMQLHSERA
jgi:hypothetical protein